MYPPDKILYNQASTTESYHLINWSDYVQNSAFCHFQC